MKTRRRRRRRSARTALRNPVRRRRRRLRSARRNPSMRRRRRSVRSVRRNPARRMRRRFSRRNPAGDYVAEAFGQETLTVAGGVLLGTAGPALIVNRMATSASMSKLPGITGNGWGRPAWKFAIALVVSYALRNKARSLSQGIMLGGVAGLGNDILVKSGAMSKITNTIAPGTAAFLGRRGAGTYIPGVPPMLSGPATTFINNGAPVARRRGMGLAVNRNWARNTASGVPDPFKSN